MSLSLHILEESLSWESYLGNIVYRLVPQYCVTEELKEGYK
jgi:hypothetical protein